MIGLVDDVILPEQISRPDAIFVDEDVAVANWDNAATNDIIVCRHEGVVTVDVDVAVNVDGAANGDGFADAAKCSRLEHDG